jgi:hypothetical protein
LLSAFLSAGRSVTFTLQNEQKKAYDEWFGRWKSDLSPEDRKFLEDMNQQRVEEVHKLGAQVSTELQYVPITQVPSEGRSFWTGPPGTPSPAIGIERHFFEFAEAPAVVAACSRYCALLEKLIKDFLSCRDQPSAADI